MDEKIRVMVVDDHPAFRFGVRTLLESAGDIQVVSEAGDGRTALALLKSVDPMVMLLDIQMPQTDGLSMITRFLKVKPELRIIMLTAYEGNEFLVEALTAGAYGYIPKSECAERIIEGVYKVKAGEKIMDSTQKDQVITSLKKYVSGAEYSKVGLTQRELELTDYLAHGSSNQEIAEKMYISLSTVKRMVETVISKLGATNKTQAVAEAMRRGYI